MGIPCPGELYRIQSADPLPVTLPHWIPRGKSCRARGAERLDPARDPSEGYPAVAPEELTRDQIQTRPQTAPTRSQQPHSGTGQQPTAKELTTTARAHRAAHGLTGAQQRRQHKELNRDSSAAAPAAIPADSLTGDQIQSDQTPREKIPSDCGSTSPGGMGGGGYPHPCPFWTTTASLDKKLRGTPTKALGDIDKARKIGYNGYRIPIHY